MSFLRRVAGLSLRDRVRSSAIREELGVELLLLRVERSQMRWLGHLVRMSPGRLPGEVLWACPSGRRAPGRPRTRWRDYVSRLVWERLGIPLDKLEEVAGERESILSVHDTVAQKNYDPELPPLPEDIDDDEDSGATIRRDDDTGAILVARIMKGGAADRSGLIHIGDELKEVNGIPVDDKKPEEVIRILVFVKALFNFDPNEDKAIPCKEAGLAFKKGSILQIMSQDDATWWQARLEVEANPRAGLIPSKQFQESPIQSFFLEDLIFFFQPHLMLVQSFFSVIFTDGQIRVHILAEELINTIGFRRSFRLSKRDKKTNKAMYESKKSEMYDMADVPTYEEVTPYHRLAGAKHRLVVFVGPTGVGLNELKKKLLISDPQHFGVTIPHTSRAKRNQESDGVEYHFISKHLFETDIHNNKFIEYGEYKGNYYGTSLDSIRSILSKNKVCLLDVQPQMIKHLRTAEFKPFVVFVKPPLIERLSETRQNAKFMSGKEDKGSVRPFKEEDFQEMVRTSEVMENQYGHLFDKVIVNDDLSIAFNELRMVLRTVETETHWVPLRLDSDLCCALVWTWISGSEQN
ncbi:MAGUK p55 subfamily member 7 [Takifugu flavidus]|uniref:MAGUK p55 subfamily member 7 n=1 Tax=Takifugu flavidus TaxID=433684 RepID=A0A5C6NZD9_9TELE|nr:MAGUK p55 subfamily member 7 [Takifugu flavidus]